MNFLKNESYRSIAVSSWDLTAVKSYRPALLTDCNRVVFIIIYIGFLV